jgi:hypothetical protein
MELNLKRLYKTDKSTVGELKINNIFECYTLEDVEREVKIFGETAIPKGKYEVVISWSNRFKKFMPLLLNVQGFDGIRIHAGNTAKNTLGCILVGKSRAENQIGNSKIAYSNLFEKLKTTSKKEKIFLTIQ